MECFHIYALPSSSNNDNSHKAKKDKYLNCFKVSSLAHRITLNFCSHQIYAKFSNCVYAFFKTHGFVTIGVLRIIQNYTVSWGENDHFKLLACVFRLPFIFLSVQQLFILSF